jgi:YjbE family integral membrane protein
MAGLFMLNPEWWGRLFSIMMIDLVLAGDNALVIALAVRGLSPHVQAVGAVWGTVGAVGLRIACALAAASVLRLPGLQILAAILLVWIAFRLVHPRRKRGHQVREASTLKEAITIIAFADVAMSLDNVLAIAAAAAGNVSLMVIGVGLSLPLVVWGSRVLAGVINRHAWLVWAGAGLLGYVAGEMALGDPMTERWLSPGLVDALQQILPLAVGCGTAAIGWWLTPPPRANQQQG